jgi:hypothetical protein
MLRDSSRVKRGDTVGLFQHYVNELLGISPAGPQSGESYPKPAISWLKLGSADALLVDGHLMTQRSELQLHGETRPEPG